MQLQLTEAFKKPAGWVKPTKYPGLTGGSFKADLAKGIVNLEGVDPMTVNPQARKLKAAILKALMKALIENREIGHIEISDPEWVLSGFYPKGKKIKDELPKDISRLLGIMFGDTAGTSNFTSFVKGSTAKGGFAWRLVVPAMKHMFYPKN